MGDCVPESLLPTLSDFLNEVCCLFLIKRCFKCPDEGGSKVSRHKEIIVIKRRTLYCVKNILAH